MEIDYSKLPRAAVAERSHLSNVDGSRRRELLCERCASEGAWKRLKRTKLRRDEMGRPCDCCFSMAQDEYSRELNDELYGTVEA